MTWRTDNPVGRERAHVRVEGACTLDVRLARRADTVRSGNPLGECAKLRVQGVVAAAVALLAPASACVLFGLRPVPCGGDNDCPAGTCDADRRECVLDGGDEGEGEGAEGEGAGGGGEGEGEGEGGDEPLFTDEFSNEATDWLQWDCAPFDFISGFATQGDGHGLMVPRNNSNMDCFIADVIVDVDMIFDVALEPDSEVFPGNPVAIGQSPMVSVRRHLIDDIGALGDYSVDEIDAILTPVDDDTIHARFAHVRGMRRGHFEDIPTEPATADAEADIDLALADPTTPVRVRVRVDGASPTRLRLKLWLADDVEPAGWLIDANLADDFDVDGDDFGVALNVFAAADPGVPTVFDNVAMYDANFVSPDQPLFGP